MPSSSSAPRPSPNIPHGGIFSPYASSTIAAPATAVYTALLDTSTWPSWNTFVPSAEITSHPSSSSPSSTLDTPTTSPILAKGTHMTFTVHLTPTSTTSSKELVFQIDPPPPSSPGLSPKGTVTRICWTLDNRASLTPTWLLRADRVNEIEDLGDGTCVYRTWETFAGPVAWIVKRAYGGQLQERFEDWVRDLKGFVESNHGKG